MGKTVQKLLSLLMGWSIPALCALSCWYHLESQDDFVADYSAVHPALVVFLASWVIADGLNTSFSCCIDTIYLSAFVDMEANHPPKYMSNDLRDGFGIDRAVEEVPPAPPSSTHPCRAPTKTRSTRSSRPASTSRRP